MSDDFCIETGDGHSDFVGWGVITDGTGRIAGVAWLIGPTISHTMGYCMILNPIEPATRINPSIVAAILGITFPRAPFQHCLRENHTPEQRRGKEKMPFKRISLLNNGGRKRLGKVER